MMLDQSTSSLVGPLLWLDAARVFASSSQPSLAAESDPDPTDPPPLAFVSASDYK